MAKISRLRLSGIRSFGPDELQDVQFQSPVTLILGENGCGKTTIIEALKYACTGTTPGGASAKALFVHNPQLQSVATTKAVIKAQFVDERGRTLVVNRAMRVESKQNKQQFSSLDATFQVTDESGKTITTSTRCADITKILGEQLRVSESILNNVIFCHQEQASWPLDEGKKVKERFDDIFDSAKYNKSIDIINSLIKIKKASLKDLESQLSTRSNMKDSVERKRAQLQKDENDLESVKTEISSKGNELIPIRQQLNEFNKQHEDFIALEKDVSLKNMEKRNLDEHLKNLEKRIKELFKGTNVELENAIKSFEEKLRNLPTIDMITDNIEKCNKSVERSQCKIGELNTEKQQYKNTISERNGNINNLSSQLGLKVKIASDSNTSIEDIVSTLKTAISESKKEAHILENECTEKENLLQKDIDKSREDVIKITQKITSNTAQIKQINQKLRDITVQLNRLGNSGEEVKQLNNKIEKIDNDLKKLSSSFNVEETESMIKIHKQDISKKEEDLKHLEKDFKILQNNFELENNIETRSKDIREKENKIFELKSFRYDEFKTLFDEIPDTNLRMEVDILIHTNSKKVSELQEKIEKRKSDVTKLEANIRFKKEEQSNLSDELETALSKISKVTKGQSYDEFYEKLERELDFYQKCKGQYESAKVMYDKFLDTFKSTNPCCPVCETDFKGKDSAISTIVDKLKEKITDIPSQLATTKEKLKKTQELFNLLQQTKPLYDRTKILQNKLIPEINVKLTNLTSEYETSVTERDALISDLMKPQKIMEVGTKIVSDATLIDKYQNEICVYRNEIEELQGQMVSIDSDKSREEVEADMKVCKLTITEKRQLCESSQKKLLEFKDQCHDLKEKRNKLFDKRMQLEKVMQGKPQLLIQEKELKSEEVILKEDINSLQHQLDPAETKLAEQQRDFQKTKQANKVVISKKHETNNKLDSTYQKILDKQHSIEMFEKKNIDKEIEEQLLKQAHFRSEIDMLNSQREMVTHSIAKQQELHDNLEIRSKKQKLEKLSQTIANIQSEIKNFNLNNLLNKIRALEKKHSDNVKETCTLKGKQEQLENTIKVQKTELNRPEFKDAYIAYVKKHFELQIVKKVIRDLQIYSKGLENAIIEFHKEKMTNINTLIKNYWRSIYCGNDIDYIQIVTDQPVTTAAAAVRRTYNYKVIQYKNDIAIEMRGCCSAGQKVLACLIIRMALSSVFSHNCGILALDEPTTNLDRENIQSLCETLANMIQDRRVEKNFQLLIITHDEDFVKMLSRSGSIESCIRVTRNHKGMSLVKREVIS